MNDIKSWSGDADEAFDPAEGEALIGKYLLVGITHLTPDGEFVRQEQLHGRIVAASAHGIDVELAGVNAGRSWRMPPMIDALDAAEPGVYELKGTGELVENPDFAIMLTIRASRRH